MRVAFFGTFDESTHPRVRVLRDGLAGAGHHVDVVNVPLDLDTAARVRLAAQPWRVVPFALQLVSAWVRLLWRSRRVRRPDVVVVGYLGAFDIHLARLRYRRATLVLDQMVQLGETVQDRDIGTSRLARILGTIDRWAADRADIVVCDTDEQAARSPGETPTVVVAVGAPASWFVAPAPAPDPDEAVRVVFFGLYQRLQGAIVIGEALALLAADTPIEVTMIGDGQDRPAAEAAAADARVAVRWVDWVRPDELPAVVAGHHVCLGIFDTGAKADRVVPNKVYQGAAAGCALVTGATSAQRRLVGAVATLTTPGDPWALADALAGLATDRDTLAARRHGARAWAEAASTAAAVIGPLDDAIRSQS